MTQKQKKTIKEEFRKFMKRELLAITPYDEEKILKFIKKTIQHFIEETKVKRLTEDENDYFGKGYNEAILNKEYNEQQWLKENL